LDTGSSALLVNKYNSSLSALVETVYTEYEWLPWKFTACPRNYWDEEDNQARFIAWATKELNVKELSDWYKVTNKVK
jgi:hypothetical protein